MNKLKWKKTYIGPFGKKEAEKLVEALIEIANPITNAIHTANVRKRRNSGMYDVYIKTEF